MHSCSAAEKAYRSEAVALHGLLEDLHHSLLLLRVFRQQVTRATHTRHSSSLAGLGGSRQRRLRPETHAQRNHWRCSASQHHAHQANAHLTDHGHPTGKVRILVIYVTQYHILKPHQLTPSLTNHQSLSAPDQAHMGQQAPAHGHTGHCCVRQQRRHGDGRHPHDERVGSKRPRSATRAGSPAFVSIASIHSRQVVQEAQGGRLCSQAPRVTWLDGKPFGSCTLTALQDSWPFLPSQPQLSLVADLNSNWHFYSFDREHVVTELSLKCPKSAFASIEAAASSTEAKEDRSVSFRVGKQWRGASRLALTS